MRKSNKINQSGKKMEISILECPKCKKLTRLTFNNEKDIATCEECGTEFDAGTPAIW